MLKTALGRFRLVAILEGISYLLLLFVAMPLKYGMDMPIAVRIVGSLHGALTIAYVIVLLHAMVVQSWSIPKSGLAFIASLIPFGAFIFDRQIADEQPA